MTVDRATEVTEALAPFAEGLRADGYALEVAEAAETLALTIVALEGACEDCLVPPAIMAPMISATLSGRYAPDQIRLTYPPSSIH